MLTIHIIAGSLGILSGFAAMFLAKGSPRHRLAGNFYTLSMIVMCVSAFIVAVFIRPQNLNVLAALLTLYLVTSSWLTIRRRPDQPGRLEYATMALGGLAVLLALVFAVRDKGAVVGFYLVFGSIAALSVASDLRYVFRRAITHTQRLVRHLWRMGFTLFIATASLFLGQAKHMPTWVTGPKINVFIALFSLGLLVYWLKRARSPTWSRKARPVTALGPAP
jgi:drug/metabolite transporter superfamily protein YnfA